MILLTLIFALELWLVSGTILDCYLTKYKTKKNFKDLTMASYALTIIPSLWVALFVTLGVQQWS